MWRQAWTRAVSGCILAVCCLLPARPARAAAPFSRLWWLNESHAATQVNDMVREPGGPLWLATDAGVIRFTGSAFIPLKDSSSPATCLYRSGDELLVGYRSGRIARVLGDSVDYISVPGGAPTASITSFATFGDVTLFSTLGEGIWALHRGRVARFGTPQGLSDDYVYAIHIVAEGLMLAATDRGLNLIVASNGRFRVRAVLPQGIVQSLRPVPGKAGEVIAGTNEGHWYALRFSGDGNFTLLRRDSIPAPVQDIAFLNDRILILGGLDTTYVYPPTSGVAAVAMDSFSIGQAGSRMLAEPGGALWLGSSSGLHDLSYGYMTHEAAASGFDLGSVSAMSYDSSGTLWYGQGDLLIGMPPAGAPRRYRLPAQITSLAADATGLWIGTLGQGLHHLDRSGRIARPAGTEPFEGEHVLSLTRYRDRLWMATLSGLDEFELAGEQLRGLRHHSKHEGLGADYVYQCVPDRLGRMWIATDGAGICCYSDGRYRRWTEGQDGFRGRTVYSITEDASGQIWAATLEHGICRFDGRRWHAIGRDEGMQSLNVTGLATLGDGQVLIVHDQGMDLWQPGNAAIRHIGRRQGMGIDSSSRMLNCVAKTSNGAVVTPFESGFLRFRPGVGSSFANPGLRILIAAAPGQAAAVNRYFAPGDNTINFRFEGSNPLNPERLWYRYRLSGFMKDWILTRDEVANFARLPAGNYEFELEAAYSASFSHPASLRFSFEIGRPLWQRGWAIAIAAGLLLLGGFLIIRFRERNIRRIEQLQNARVQMEYEHLKSQINPHFLFNSLNILGTLIPRDPARAVDYTYALSDLYRNTLHYRDKELIPLEEEWSVLTQYLLVQKTRFGEALQLDAEVPETVMKRARVVPLALQLLVENVIKHNVVSASAPLTVRIFVRDNRLIVSNSFRPKRNPEKGTGIGLANISSRYGLHKQEIRYGLANDTFTVELPLL